VKEQQQQIENNSPTFSISPIKTNNHNGLSLIIQEFRENFLFLLEDFCKNFLFIKKFDDDSLDMWREYPICSIENNFYSHIFSPQNIFK
jgi:hypothetical protein